MRQVERPNSVTNTWVNYTGVCCMVVGFIFCLQNQPNILYTISICILSYAVPIILLEIAIFKTTLKMGIDKQSPHKINIKRVLTKLLALFFTLFILILCYWYFPEYHKDRYTEYWRFFELVAVVIMICALPYFIYVDTKSKDPFDAYWLIGRYLCGKFKSIQHISPKEKRRMISQHLLSWTVKGYFMPVMFVYLAGNVNLIYHASKANLFANININIFFSIAIVILFSIDLIVALTGYLLTLKLFDSHVRSTDATCFGWLVCLICYIPFYYNILMLFLSDMRDINSWMTWISNEYILSLWYFMVLVLLAIYVMATIAFGIRFSNLTNRGIITNGPYRLTKHPAYISKNLFWWFATVPFSILASDPIVSIKAMLSLLGINLVYYFRAKTEEKHLSNDPIYVQYALWMNENGIFAPIAKKLPLLLYNKPSI